MSIIQVVQSDALDTLRELPDHLADAMVMDPPYCSGGSTETERRSAKYQGLRSSTREERWFRGDNMGTAGLIFMLRSIAFEATRIVKPSGSLLIFCDWRMVCSLAPAIESAGVRFQNLIVWDKGSAGLGNGFRPQHEMVMHFTLGASEFFSNSGSNLIGQRRVSPNKKQHVTEKPVDLMRELIRVVAPKGGLVVDPFGGSGSTGVAAHAEGVDALLVERDARHAATARRRCGEAGALVL